MTLPMASDDPVVIIEGDAADVLATMLPRSVNLVVTSPPYADQ